MYKILRKSCIMILIVLAGCAFFRYPNPDPFYVSTGTWDSARFPLIKPYDAVYGNERYGWVINLPSVPGEPALYGSVSRVEKISVVNDAILIYTPDKPGFSEALLEQLPIYYWYAIVPESKIQRGFRNENDFLEYAKQLGITDITWENPQEFFDRFKETGCLDWIPGC